MVLADILPKHLRKLDDTELPNAEWDDTKIAEVTLEEVFEFFLRKLTENVKEAYAFDKLV